MIFLIHYDRKQGELITLESFPHSEREKAENKRLDLELSLFQKTLDHEVVLLEAASEMDLRKTHRRYFENYQDIAST